MAPLTEDKRCILALLAHAPVRLAEATRGSEPAQLNRRTDEEPWSVSDILTHLRACSDVWGQSIVAMIVQDNPTRRYVSPRSWLKKPMYREQAFAAALASFTGEREKLVQTLVELDDAGWLRRGTFTGVSAQQRDQTVWSYANRIVNHEQPHLEQIEPLLR